MLSEQANPVLTGKYQCWEHRVLEELCLFASCLFRAVPVVMQKGRIPKSDRLSLQMILLLSLGTENLLCTQQPNKPTAQVFSFQHFYINEVLWLGEVMCLAKNLPEIAPKSKYPPAQMAPKSK